MYLDEKGLEIKAMDIWGSNEVVIPKQVTSTAVLIKNLLQRIYL
jgi:hypothetical protein